MGRRWTAGIATVLTAGMLAACGGTSVNHAEVDCAALLRFDGRTYVGVVGGRAGQVDVVPADHRSRVGEGLYPQCGPPSNGVPAEEVRVYRIDGVAVPTAVAADDGRIWVVHGARLPVSVSMGPWITYLTP